MIASLAYQSLSYTIVLSASYWLWIATEIWLIARERRDANAISQDRGSRNLLIVSLSLAIVLGIFAAPVLLPQFTVHTKIVATGVALIWAGIAVRIWAIRTLGNFSNMRVVVRRDQRLRPGHTNIFATPPIPASS